MEGGNMKKSKGFTLIELLVVIAIIALLMAILMPALQRVKKQAKAVVCQSNLHQWSLIFSMYTSDNDSRFGIGWTGADIGISGHRWVKTLKPYYRDKDICFCPAATKFFSEGGRGSLAAWGGGWDQDWGAEKGQYGGSYGLNEFVSNPPPGVTLGWREADKRHWRTPNVRGTNNIPLFLGCWLAGGYPFETDSPPEYDGVVRWGDEMIRYCVNRHDSAVNSAFLDFSVKKIGLKELWTLKWNRGFDINGSWTKAGGVQAGDWPQWMISFKDY